MKRANDQLHVDNNAPANTIDAFSHTQKRVRHANALCLTLSCDIDSCKAHLEAERAGNCLEKMEMDHNHVKVCIVQSLLGIDTYLYLVA
jgi:hypothetical protein